MYQFDFVLSSDDPETISVFGETYAEAVTKIKAIGIPNFKLADWKLEAIYEHGVAKLISV
jgi:hypothetical protein